MQDIRVYNRAVFKVHAMWLGLYLLLLSPIVAAESLLAAAAAKTENTRNCQCTINNEIVRGVYVTL